MKRRFQIFTLRLAIAAVSLPLVCTGAAHWRLAAVRSRLQTRLANLKAYAPRRPH